jgi:CheY-like chemotaxis protein
MQIGSVDATIDVLLVENDPGDAMMAREAFGQAGKGTRLHVVSGRERALRFLRRGDGHGEARMPGLIMLSFDLPEEHSLKFLAEVKEDPDLKVVPVVVLSTSQDPSDVERSYGMHANAYVIKPADYDGFAEVVTKVSEFFTQVSETPRPPTKAVGARSAWQCRPTPARRRPGRP